MGLGWQGIIPSKAAEMAEIVTTLMTTKLIDIKEVFQRCAAPDMSHHVVCCRGSHVFRSLEN